LAPGLSFADEQVPPPDAVPPKLPASNLSADLIGRTISISPKSNSKFHIDVKGSSHGEGAAIVAKKKKSGIDGRFEIFKSGDNTYAIRSASTGRLIAENDGKIVQTGMTAATDDTQRWAITKRSGGYYFTNAATADRLSFSKSAVGSASAGTKVSDAQIFNLKVNPIALKGYYTFTTQAGNAIALSKASVKNGTAMVLKKDVKNSVGRQFFVLPLSSGYYAIRSSISFKALDIKGSSKKSGTKLIQSTYDKGKNQRFKLTPSGDGWYLLKSALGPYVSAASDKAKAKVVTTNDKAKALRLRIGEAEYSSGLPELDSKLKKIHKSIGSKGDMMKKSWSYVVTHYRYAEHPNDFSGDWISRYAYYMISRKNGHCKNFAATLCVLFRSYGYDARVVTGYVPSLSRGWAPHGWVETNIGGKIYTFDPDLQQEIGGRNWYKRTYQNAPVRYRIEKRW
jgi:hypothetical protein